VSPDSQTLCILLYGFEERQAPVVTSLTTQDALPTSSHSRDSDVRNDTLPNFCQGSEPNDRDNTQCSDRCSDIIATCIAQAAASRESTLLSFYSTAASSYECSSVYLCLASMPKFCSHYFPLPFNIRNHRNKVLTADHNRLWSIRQCGLRGGS
jgi:hypothetical protein